jgi:predicted N-formylglutamate amidohydrolase
MLKVVVTCEHAGNLVPDKYRPLFREQGKLLQTHQGYDIGAFPVFASLAGEEVNASFFAEKSRLLVDLNRSLHSPELFSVITASLPPAEKEELLRGIYYPYRTAVESKIKQWGDAGHRVVHLSVHSFTPVLEGEERQAEVGLLFDPNRDMEKIFCEKWRALLLEEDPGLIIKMNYPYLGTADGFTTYLRTVFGPEVYAGIELEVNQKFFLSQGEDRQTALIGALRRSLMQLLHSLKQTR